MKKQQNYCDTDSFVSFLYTPSPPPDIIFWQLIKRGMGTACDVVAVPSPWTPNWAVFVAAETFTVKIAGEYLPTYISLALLFDFVFIISKQE